MRLTLSILIILGLDAWAIYRTFHSEISTAVKLTWAVVIICLPLLGLVLWALLGPRMPGPREYEDAPP